MKTRNARIGLAVALVLALVGGIVVAARSLSTMDRTHITAYFDNSNGLFRRRRGPHPGCAGRADRHDRTRSRTG